MKMPSHVPMFGAGTVGIFRGQRPAPRPEADGEGSEVPGRGWFNSSLELAQGLEVTEGLPLDELPEEWRRDFRAS